jgi:hypothetical protein
VLSLLCVLRLQLHAVQVPVTAPLVWHVGQQPLDISTAVTRMVVLLLQLLPVLVVMMMVVVVGVSAVLHQQRHSSVHPVDGRKHLGSSMRRPRLQL